MVKNTIQDLGLSRRLVALSLGLTPGDLRATAGVHPVKVSQVLGGSARFTSSETASLARLAGRLIRQVFGE